MLSYVSRPRLWTLLIGLLLLFSASLAVAEGPFPVDMSGGSCSRWLSGSGDWMDWLRCEGLALMDFFADGLPILPFAW